MAPPNTFECGTNRGQPRAISSGKKLAFALVPCILLVLLAEGSLFTLQVSQDGWQNSLAKSLPMLGIPWKRSAPGDVGWRSKYDHLRAEYYVYNSQGLGVHFRPRSKLVALEAGSDGTPRIAQKMHLWTDGHGFVANEDKPDSDRDYAALSQDPRVCRVLASGGSTTAGWGAESNSATWPAVLEQLLNADPRLSRLEFEKFVVINSGVFGYAISQEIKRFLDETCYLRPHVVISFNGINERRTYRGNPVDYGTIRGHRDIESAMNHAARTSLSPILPYTVAWLREKWRDGNQRTSPALYGYRRPDYPTHAAGDLYVEKAQQFKALCEAADCRFIHVLQPVMGVGNKRLTNREEQLKRFFDGGYYSLDWKDYVESIREFYADVQGRMEEPWHHDLTGAFDEVPETVYSDPRHYNGHGQRLLAERLRELVVAELTASPGSGRIAQKP